MLWKLLTEKILKINLREKIFKIITYGEKRLCLGVFTFQQHFLVNIKYRKHQ